jgi:hypothetical protein
MSHKRVLFPAALLALLIIFGLSSLWAVTAEEGAEATPDQAATDAAQTATAEFNGTQTAIALTATANANASATAAAQTAAAQTAAAQTAAAQTAVAQTLTAQAPVDMEISRFEPNQITTGNTGSISVYGANFTPESKIHLVGFGLLETQFINSGYLIGALPNTIAPGGYRVEVTDPTRNVERGGEFRVNPPPNTQAPPPTETMIPTQTTVPTAIPGQPSLVARNFSANPGAITPGGTTTLTFEVVNQGSRVAQGVSVSVDPGGSFAPANGQSGATLPDIPIGGVVTIALSVTSAMDTAAGPGSIPVTFTYHDFEGTAYTSKATLSVTVLSVDEAPQVTLARYMTDPNPVLPGDPIMVTVLVTNTGNKTASQVLLRISGENSVLLAGPQGNSFPLGDLAPGASTSVELPLVVSRDAKPGPQAQPITITYLQEGEAKETTGAMTVDVAEVIEPEPLLLLESYDLGRDQLKPGDRFTFNMTLQNVGDAPAVGLLVTFGTVESTGSDSGADTTGGSPGSGSTGGSSTSTTPSTTFAPLGAGGTLFVGTVAADGGTIAISQDFIVNGTVNSGIYSLPITLRYTKPDGSAAQDSLRASVVVVAPPKLLTVLQTPLPETANVGEPFPVAIELSNSGTATINLREALVTTDNGEIVEGATTLLTPMGGDDDAMINALVMPQEEGPVRVTVTIRYIDDLSQPAEIVLTYDSEAVQPPPPPEEPPPMIEETPPPAEPTTEDRLGRLLLGLLGLGS